MRRKIKIGLFVLILISPILFVACKITLLNPTWRIRSNYPDVKIDLYAVNSPGVHIWTTIAGSFGIPMLDSDHALSVRINQSSKRIDLGHIRQPSSPEAGFHVNQKT